MADDTITFDAVVEKVQTTVDGGIRITLDTDQDQIVSAAWLMAAKRDGVVLTVTCQEK